ncbi:MAG: phosphoesterase PA-phosphatase related protein [Parcubacteria group bacterium]|nr:phosphoesterase PA-phosphatase related protein [Parcubacteria group bacterium]
MVSSYKAKLNSRDPWWHVVGLIFGLLFVLMLMLARLYPPYLDRIDDVVEHLLTPLQTLTLIEPFLVITVLGSVTGVIVTALGAVYLLRRNRFTVLQLVLALGLAGVSMGIAKNFVERVRPNVLEWVNPLSSYSFPSGHATLSTVLYGFFAVCLYRRVRNPALRFISVAACILIIFLVCLSRLVLNYHYATDVTAGVFLGIFWLAVVFMLPKRRL